MFSNDNLLNFPAAISSKLEIRQLFMEVAIRDIQLDWI